MNMMRHVETEEGRSGGRARKILELVILFGLRLAARAIPDADTSIVLLVSSEGAQL